MYKSNTFLSTCKALPELAHVYDTLCSLPLPWQPAGQNVSQFPLIMASLAITGMRNFMIPGCEWNHASRPYFSFIPTGVLHQAALLLSPPLGGARRLAGPLPRMFF